MSRPKTLNYSRAIQQISKHMKAIASERDKLDDFISDMQSLKDDCDEAYSDLERARDALSRLV